MAYPEPTSPSGAAGSEERPTVMMDSVPELPAPPSRRSRSSLYAEQQTQAAEARSGWTRPAPAQPAAPAWAAPTRTQWPGAGTMPSSDAAGPQTVAYSPAGQPGGYASAPAAQGYPGTPQGHQPGPAPAYPPHQWSAPPAPTQQSASPQAAAQPSAPVEAPRRRDERGGADPQARRSLGPGWIAWIVIDVLLVLIAIVMGVRYFAGGDDPSGATAAPSSHSEPTGGASTAAGPAAAPEKSFATPSGNITCDMAADGVSCVIRKIDSRPAACGPSAVAVGATLSDGVSAEKCLTTASAVPDAGSLPALAYEQSEKVGQYVCTSTRQGVTCTDGAHGFAMARAGISLS